MSDSTAATETTTKKQIPTVAKVQEMIDENIKDESTYKVNALTVNESDSYYGPYSNGVRRYYTIPEEYKIKVGIIQGSTNKPTIALGTSSSDIVYKFDYALDTDFVLNQSINKYTSSATLDLSNLVFVAKPDITKIGLYIALSESYYEWVVSLPISQTSYKIFRDLLDSIEHEYNCLINTLTPFNDYVVDYGDAAERSDAWIVCKRPSWQIIDDHTITITFIQDNTTKPTIQIRTGEKVLYTFNYNLSSEFTELGNDYKFGSRIAYTATANLDVSSVELTGIFITTGVNIWVEQNEEFYATANLPLRKKMTAITKPDDNTILSFSAFRDLIYPVGAIYISNNNINPGTFMGIRWESITSPISGSYAWKRIE